MIFAPHSSRRSTWRSSGQISILAGKIKIRMDIHDVSDFKYRRRGIVLNSLVKVYFGSTPITFDLSHHDKTDMSHSSLAFTWDQLAYRGINLFNSSPTQLKPLIEGRHISLLIELLLLQLDVWTSWGAFRKESSSFLCFSCSSVPSRFVSWIYSFVFSIFNLFYPSISPGSSLICLHRSTRCLYLMSGTVCCSGPNGHYCGAGTTWSLLAPAAGITQSAAQITAGTAKILNIRVGFWDWTTSSWFSHSCVEYLWILVHMPFSWQAVNEWHCNKAAPCFCRKNACSFYDSTRRGEAKRLWWLCALQTPVWCAKKETPFFRTPMLLFLNWRPADTLLEV